MFWNKKEQKAPAPQLTDATFNEAIETDKGILLDFYASWCGPYKVLSPIIDELAAEYKDRVVIAKVDSEKNPNLSNFFKIKSIPTLVFIKDKKLIEVINGLVPKPNLKEMIDDLIEYQFEIEEESEGEEE
jgi:thioredoxin 1